MEKLKQCDINFTLCRSGATKQIDRALQLQLNKAINKINELVEDHNAGVMSAKFHTPVDLKAKIRTLIHAWRRSPNVPMNPIESYNARAQQLISEISKAVGMRVGTANYEEYKE